MLHSSIKAVVYVKTQELSEALEKYEILEFHEDTMKLQLTFTKVRDFQISGNAKFVQLFVLDPSMYVSSINNYTFKAGYSTNKLQIPLQIREEDDAFLDFISQIFARTLEALIASNIALNFLFNYSLSLLWSMLNALQLLAYLPLLHLQLPANAHTLLKQLLYTLNLDVIKLNAVN